jgi:hypothetical protein
MVIEPLSAATLGSLAYDRAQSEITKWVGARIKDRVQLARRNHVLNQGKPAEDQQTELKAVIIRAVELTAAEQFPGEERLQGLFKQTLLVGSSQNWPLVNGSDLTYVTEDVYAWITKRDPQTGARSDDPKVHPYLAILCRNIIAQFGFRAENNGAKNTILYPRWSRFWTTELFNSALSQTRPDTLGSLPQPSSVWPRRLGSIPSIATAWQERQISAILSVALADRGTAVACQILSGMGGVGKTQIAANYAHQLWNQRDVDLLMWVNAASQESVTAMFAQAGGEFCDTDPSDSAQAAHDFLAWLAGPTAPRWLIILDDLTDPDDLRGLWPPTSELGRTIVTTRRRDAALESHARARIDVHLYTPEEALRYLTDRLIEPKRLDGAAALAAFLGHLPLAIGQAAVYILDQPGMSCTSYQELLSDRTQTLEQLSPDYLPDEYPHTVAAALTIAIEHADRHQPTGLASHLLAVASLLSPAGIPSSLFNVIDISLSTGEPKEVAKRKDKWARHLPPRAISDTLARLHRLNLVDHDGAIIRVHALVQRARREQIDPTLIDLIGRASAQALTAIWNQPPQEAGKQTMLRSNVYALLEHASSALLLPRPHPILFWTGGSLGGSGQVQAALDYYAGLLYSCEQLHGPDHPDTLTTRNNRARWLHEAGDQQAAVSEYEAVLLAQQRTLGPDHPETLTTRHNLARCRADQGNTLIAANEFRAILTQQLLVLGPDHPDTLATRASIAVRQAESGNLAEAIAELQRILADRQRVLGSDHWLTMTTRQNLAYYRGLFSDPNQALEDLAAVVQDQTRVLGPDHPDTLSARHDLAFLEAKAGMTQIALPALRATLSDQIRVLGPDHPDTRTTKISLEHWESQAPDES